MIVGSHWVCQRCGKRLVVSVSQQVGAVVCKDCATGKVNGRNVRASLSPAA